MSDVNQTPENPTSHKDAKAQAKAAQAYAKAQRPAYKKKRVIIPAILAVLILFGAVAGGGGSEDAPVANETIVAGTDEPSDTPTDGDAANEPAEPKAEAPAEDKNVLDGQWKVTNVPGKDIGSEYGMFKNVKVTVENVGDGADSPWLELVLTNGNEVVTVYDCMGDELAPGQTQQVECISLDDYAKYTKVEVRSFL